MYLIDSHTHIYLQEFDEYRSELIQRARNSGVNQLLMPAIDSTTHEAMLQAEKSFPGCLSMMGLHPCSVKERFEKELDLIKQYLKERKFIAVGEIGLDFYWDKTFAVQQYQAFEEQISLALKYDLPISIHSRNATEECIEVVQQYPGLKGVFHCFSGNEEQAQKIISMGFFLGIGGVVTFKNSGLDKVVENLGIAHLILETDAPYLAPVPFRGKRNEPSYLKIIAEKIALVCKISIEDVAITTTENARNLFRL